MDGAYAVLTGNMDAEAKGTAGADEGEENQRI